MLAGQLINAPFQRLSQAEVIGMQGQNLLAADSVKHPIRQLDFHPDQAPVEPVLATNGCGIYEAKAVALLIIACADIRCNARSGEPIIASHRAS